MASSPGLYPTTGRLAVNPLRPSFKLLPKPPGSCAPNQIPFQRVQITMLRRAFLQSTISAPLIATWKQGPPRQFETELLSMMEVGPVPGAVIGTLRDAKPGWIRPLGFRNIETREPV